MRVIHFATVVAVILFDAASAYFVVPLGIYPLVRERVDPIVSPGYVSSHAHAVFGSSGFDFDLTTKALRAAKCTGSPIKADMSSYWLPQMYFAWSNGSFSSLEGSLTVYYHFDEDGSTIPFPEDFSMRAGDPSRTTYDASRYDNQVVMYRCVPTMQDSPDYTKNNCPGGMRAEVSFPRCWDGKRVQSADNSHVSFPTDKTFEGPAVLGICPDTHPKKVPHLMFEMAWYVDPFKDDWDRAVDTEAPFVLSNGDGKGYSAHGDFFNGWDPDVLEAALNDPSCHKAGDEGGVFSDCAPLKPSLQPSGDCFLTPHVDEPVLGTIAALPGCHPFGKTTACGNTDGDFVLSPATIWTGDRNAPPADACRITNGDLASLPAGCTRSPAPAPKGGAVEQTVDGEPEQPKDPPADPETDSPKTGGSNQQVLKTGGCSSQRGGNALLARLKRHLVQSIPRRQ